jgi:hypothetical protein
MSSFAPGTSKEEMDRVNKRLYGAQPAVANAANAARQQQVGAAANAANAARQQQMPQMGGQPQVKPMGAGVGFGNSADSAQLAKLKSLMSGNPTRGPIGGNAPMGAAANAANAARQQQMPQMGAAANAQKTVAARPAVASAKPMTGGMGQAPRMKSGGQVSASKRADGIASKGKTRGKMC